MNFIPELGYIFITASLIGIVGRFIRLPIIITYILAGILIGPVGLKLIADPAQVETLATLGVVFLLFLVGVELNITRLKHVGSVSLITVFLQIIIALLVGFGVGYWFNFSPTASIFLGLALSFNSTVLVVKSLSERHEIESLYGQIAIGILLIQDAIAIAILIILGSISHGGSNSLAIVQQIALDGLLLVAGTALIAKYIFPHIFKSLAKTPELLTVSAIGWALLIALIAERIGLSLEVGAFIAGVSISALPYTTEITAKIRAIRDFFVAIFFVTLGISLASFNSTIVGQASVISLLVLIGTPLVITCLLLIQGFKARTSLLSGLRIGQIGEFSLKIIALAYFLHLVDQSFFSMITLAVILTILLSSLIIAKSDILARNLGKIFARIEFKQDKNQSVTIKNAALSDHVVVFGAHRIGQTILRKLKKHSLFKENIVVVDINPAIISALEKENIIPLYGDMIDSEILDSAHIDKAKLVISTAADDEANLAIIKRIKKNHHYNTVIFVTAETPDNALKLYQAGADFVILPQYLSGEYVSDLIRDFDENKIKIQKRRSHIEELEHTIAIEK